MKWDNLHAEYLDFLFVENSYFTESKQRRMNEQISLI